MYDSCINFVDPIYVVPIRTIGVKKEQRSMQSGSSLLYNDHTRLARARPTAHHCRLAW